MGNPPHVIIATLTFAILCHAALAQPPAVLNVKHDKASENLPYNRSSIQAGVPGGNNENVVAIVWGKFKFGDRESKYLYQCLPLERGDALPIGRDVYRVASFKASNSFNVFELNTALKLDEDLPAKYQLAEDTFVFPLNAMTCEFANPKFGVRLLEAKETDAPRLQIGFARSLGEPVPENYDRIDGQVVGVGDWIDFGEYKFKLISIVPPNPRLKIGGWFELHNEPQAVEDPMKTDAK